MKKPFVLSLPKAAEDAPCLQKENHFFSELIAIGMGARQTVKTQKNRPSPPEMGRRKPVVPPKLRKPRHSSPLTRGTSGFFTRRLREGPAARRSQGSFSLTGCAGGTLSLLRNTKTASFPYTPFFYQNRFYYTPEFRRLSIGF
ncbi:hypothetical protein [Faecalispora sporosphaeroides]|uniref:hypothetical protein n=1 Tax=Faecalispora sporosphaeroides TaxID=1549 RepID=UPI0012B6327E|nr:hypothetical protein [Faecalispora sporosphaeroides]